jgi:hypothetical protein
VYNKERGRVVRLLLICHGSISPALLIVLHLLSTNLSYTDSLLSTCQISYVYIYIRCLCLSKESIQTRMPCKVRFTVGSSSRTLTANMGAAPCRLSATSYSVHSQLFSTILVCRTNYQLFYFLELHVVQPQAYQNFRSLTDQTFSIQFCGLLWLKFRKTTFHMLYFQPEYLLREYFYTV